MTTSFPNLTAEQIQALGDELDELRGRLVADLGERDAEYIRKVIRAQRGLEVAGRGLLFAGFLPPAWIGGTAALAVSKILDNMEIGHNVMHGQYDWMQDPSLDSKRFEWDTACPGDQWRHSHNYVHHTHTNVLGKDRDIGYGVLRMSEDQPWRRRDLGNPVYATLLALLFQWGVATHDLEVERIEAGEISLADKRDILQAVWHKGRRQVLKDYVAFPLLAGPSAPFVLTGNLTANLARNVWSFMIIFCGHFPEGTHEFSEQDVADETRGGWYLRQMLGSANITGGRLFHLLSGNLSHQIEHHLFPDIPAHRYAEIAVDVRHICDRFNVPYNSGSLHRQFGSVAKKIVRLALPGRGGPAPAEPDTVAEPAPVREPVRLRPEADGGAGVVGGATAERSAAADAAPLHGDGRLAHAKAAEQATGAGPGTGRSTGAKAGTSAGPRRGRPKSGHARKPAGRPRAVR